jgi:hypothetical protein
VVLDVPSDLFLCLFNLASVSFQQHFEVIRINIEIIVANLDHLLLDLVHLRELGELLAESFDLLTNALFLFFGELETMIFLGSELGLLDGVDGGIGDVVANIGEASQGNGEEGFVETVDSGVKLGDISFVCFLECQGALIKYFFDLGFRHEVDTSYAFKSIE